MRYCETPEGSSTRQVSLRQPLALESGGATFRPYGADRFPDAKTTGDTAITVVIASNTANAILCFPLITKRVHLRRLPSARMNDKAGRLQRVTHSLPASMDYNATSGARSRNVSQAIALLLVFTELTFLELTPDEIGVTSHLFLTGGSE